MHDDRILNVNEAAKLVHAAPATLLQYIRRGELPAARLGKHMVIVYDDLVAGLPRPPMRWYGATNPGEFFSVATEVFFEQATDLSRLEPALYDVLLRFYRQDPAAREARA